ncbi:asparagine synthase-related protein [Evansella sp. LMS18]|uniref:asparagine synthase-related protein n=1 Tax=Evansella sp. LMS18 TaxID=2924033 RepID=UPI0020D139FB|nr:asparagine synthase-related protein [Evansella sp. LMS18]UTR10557.1 asparagine synthase-related protein [Evansella sp. LMS18]
MSAIAGIFREDESYINPEYTSILLNGLQSYQVDDIQSWHKNNMFLGSIRQWITPESIGEQDPHYDPQRKLAVTADAIIDNREELFNRLQIPLRSRDETSDTELILLGFEKWGETVPEYLVGDFAFIVWDEREQKLFGARDFSGSRTLYYNYANHQFSFCTTIRPILGLPYIKIELNEQWLAEFLAITTVIDTVDASLTPYKSIYQVPPAHSITVHKGSIKMKKYCSLRTGKKLKLKSDGDYIEAFHEVFSKAVKSRLRTHKHVGAQLSGGLDSGITASYAAKLLKKQNRQLYTFSYVPPADFEDYTPGNLMPDETEFIKKTASYIGGVNAHISDFEGEDPYSVIDEFLETLEMPYKFFENSFWIKGIFEAAHNEGAGVLLNGGRGNLTVSWGSAPDFYAVLLKRLRWIKLFQELDQYSKIAGGARLRRVPSIVKLALPSFHGLSGKAESPLPSLINPAFAARTNIYEKLKDYGLDETGWFASQDIYRHKRNHFEEVFHWNASSTVSSKLSLQHKLWKRDPTNDLRVVKFCLSLPENQYVQNGMDRALIRRAAKDLLPDEIRLNQRIRGVQGADWVHRMKGEWQALLFEARRIVSDPLTKEFINTKRLREAINNTSDTPKSENAVNPDCRFLMRSVVVHRFLKKFT